MNLSYNWLKEIVPFELSPQELAVELTKVGCCVEDIVETDGDWMLVAEVTTNRPDWLCHWGVAHEIAAFTGIKLNLPEIKLPSAGKEKIADITSVENKAEDLCPRYTARVIKGVKIAPSPEWLQKRLLAVGMKPRNNVVDITNLILIEMNQPLHAFDFDLLSGKKIVVRHAEEGEKFVSVFDEERKLKNTMCVIADAEKAVALAGVKGGKDTGVHDGTVNILLESAYFDKASTRKSSQASQLDSDSSYRFERGIDPGGVEQASARAAQLICELAGGTLVDGIIDTNPDLAKPWEVEMRFCRCTKLLGMRVEPRAIEKIFIGLGLKPVEKTPSHIVVEVPTFREDLTREADLIEEVARCHGYSNIPMAVNLPQVLSHINDETAMIRKTTEMLIGFGYHETMTDSFVGENLIKEFDPSYEKLNGEYVRIKNPVREDRPFMRVSLIPLLLEVRRVNRDFKNVGFFEINRVYIPQSKNKVNEPLNLCMLDARGIDYVKGAFERLICEQRIKSKCEFIPVTDKRKGFADGTVSEIKADGKPIGLCGMAAKDVCNRHDLLDEVAILEINFTKLVEQPVNDIKFKDLPKFPGITRDIALVVKEDVRWKDIEERVMEKPQLIEKVEFASCYRGKQIGPGMKSMAFSIFYRNPERSFTDEEANALRDNMVKHLTGKFEGSSIRQ